MEASPGSQAVGDDEDLGEFVGGDDGTETERSRRGVLIPLAASGALGLGAVVATHELAEILVIANGLRARRSLHRPTSTTDVAAADRAVVHV